ncbi:finger 397-like [Podarcis lilfordi]|uniref:Finger 397-like n=1 Tax=Podarcis lilfordi TaxID=74358 RepID=A0AA35K0L4_9SAUR|nr:finger 397-like [Podarcis lilfordi]
MAMEERRTQLVCPSFKVPGIKMEKLDSAGPGQREGAGGIPHTVEAKSLKEFLWWAAPQQMKREPEGSFPVCWDAQWQDFLKAVQFPHCGQMDPQLGESTLQVDNGRVLVGTARCSPWLLEERGRWLLPRPGGKAHPACVQMASSGQRDEGDFARTEANRQRFRRFLYEEATGPQEACGRLRQLCRLWLEPERRSKEQVLELVVLEQFLSILPQEMQGWVRREEPVTTSQAAGLVEDFLRRQLNAERLERQVMAPKTSQRRIVKKSPGNHNLSRTLCGKPKSTLFRSRATRGNSSKAEGEPAQERSRTSARSVGKAFYTGRISSSTRGRTPGRSRSPAQTAGNASIRARTSSPTKGSTRERSPTSVWRVGRALVGGRTL